MYVIVFINDNGGVSIINPVTPITEKLDAIAYGVENVPTGKRFQALVNDMIPSDRTYRDAWTVDDSELVDGVGND